MIAKYGRSIQEIHSEKKTIRSIETPINDFLSNFSISREREDRVRDVFVDWAERNNVEIGFVRDRRNLASSIWKHRKDLPRHIAGKLDAFATSVFLLDKMLTVRDSILTASIGLGLEEDCTKDSIRLSYELYHERGY